MREQFLEQAKARGPHGVNHLRELLQWEILAALHSAQAFKEVAFAGGTVPALAARSAQVSRRTWISARKSQTSWPLSIGPATSRNIWATAIWVTWR